MNNRLKIGTVLLSLSTLVACGSDSDNNTKYSDDYITKPATPVEPDPVDDDPIDNKPGETEENLVLNGDFASWTTIDGVTTPDSWTTIEDGITVTEETSIIYSGESSAAIAVLTDEQGYTDFRQSVDVEAGKTYQFSSWVYHTDGGVKARLYVADYQDYSNPDLVNEWQEVTYTYTASADASIEIGLRFYDISTSFVEGEIVYVDAFTFVEGEAEVIEPEPTPEPVEPVDPVDPVEPIEPEEPIVTNALLNGDFEAWTDGTPDSWTTIDTGITITANNSIVNNGDTAVEVSVNTGSQGSTDIRQSVAVSAGTTYSYSAWVYHTQGTIYSVLYIDSTYVTAMPSDSTLLNQWQEVSYSYTASETKDIEVGIRFYDIAATFDTSEIVYIDNFSLSAVAVDPSTYYDSATNLSGFALKTELHNIINDHSAQSYGDLWDFMAANTLDIYYENDNSILDMYSENPEAADSYNYVAVTNQCGNYSGEGSCYNREHSFPKSWFDDASPMYTDIHHLFATDGYVNGKRSNYPFGEVGSASWTSNNGSLLGTSSSDLGYTGTVFEPIDEFKGDFARAYFYMATRYEDIISTWYINSDNADAVLDGSSDEVYEAWVIAMLKSWHEADPVSQKELDRNEAAYEFQGNRNPFIDHPEYVSEIWVD